MRKSAIHEPRWPALVAMIADAFVYLALPPSLSIGPRGLLLAVIVFLIVPLVFSYRRGRHDIARILAIAANAIITLTMIASLVFLIQGLPSHRESPSQLLRAAAALWISNVFVFALWYWKLDAGGPLGRDTAGSKFDSSFLFPQVLRPDNPDPNWSPQFMDYLFLAFNTSTAFSPTDTAVLSRWAKFGMMVQAIISLAIIALLAARAVNIL
ncbi:MAG: hypothetical protein WBE09_01135 [Candidatus Acidiferrales bacterium]